jgi:hypothetical protein
MDDGVNVGDGAIVGGIIKGGRGGQEIHFG